MPLYPFQCWGADPAAETPAGCGHTFEEFAAMRDAPPTGSVRRCPKCGASAVRVLQLPAAVHDDLRPYWSESMGTGFNEDGSLQAGIPGETYRRDGALLVKGKRHRRELMERMGLADRKAYG